MKDFTLEKVSIEPLRRGDETTIQEIFDGMSPEARFHRFMQAMPRLRPNLRRILADVDGEKHNAWVARVDGRAVGIVRIIADQYGDFELAVSVIDAIARRGVGRRLVEVALENAARSGVDEVVVMIHPQNQASVKLFRSMGAAYRLDFGLLVGRVPTPEMAVAA